MRLRQRYPRPRSPALVCPAAAAAALGPRRQREGRVQARRLVGIFAVTKAGPSSFGTVSALTTLEFFGNSNSKFWADFDPLKTPSRKAHKTYVTKIIAIIKQRTNSVLH